jgi:hypothetical protein
VLAAVVLLELLELDAADELELLVLLLPQPAAARAVVTATTLRASRLRGYPNALILSLPF